MNLPPKIIEVFIEVFGEKGKEINIETSITNFHTWDSMRHMELISALEKKFDIKINFREAMEIESVKNIINTINKKIKN